MNWADVAKLGDLSIGLIAGVVVVKLVLDFVAKMRVRRELGGEAKSPELLAIETLAEVQKLRETFATHDKADRDEFRRLLAALERSDKHLSREIRELRDEIRANRGGLVTVERQVAVLEHRVGALEGKKGRP